MEGTSIQKAGRIALGVARVLQVLLAAGFCWSVWNMIRFWEDMQNHGRIQGCISLAYLAGIFLLFVPLGWLLQALKQERTPFTHKNASLLKKMALILVVLGLMRFLSDLILSGTVWMVGGANGAAVMERHVSFDLSIILFFGFAAVLFGIAVVFEYGAVLQQQSDETL